MPIFSKKNNKKADVKIALKHPKTKEHIYIYDFEPQIDIEDRYMVKAKVKIGENEPYNICFRNPQDISTIKMRNEYVFTGLAKIGYLDNLEYGKYNYLGTITHNDKKKSNPYAIVIPKKDDINYVRKNMDTQLAMFEERQKQKEKTEETEEQTKEETFKKEIEISEETKKELNEYWSNKEKNKENPFLRIKTMGKEKIYEGVDFTTGDYFVLKKLKADIVDERYIYTGYLKYLDTLQEESTQKESVNEKDDVTDGYEVIFELPFEIDSAIEKENTFCLLDLLSKNEILLKGQKLNLLGKVEKDGKMYRHPYKASAKIFEYYKQKAKEAYNKYNKQKEENEK